MDNNEKTSEKITKWLLVGISVLFLAVMLLLPLITVITEALRSGWKVYAAAVTDEYTIKALLLTVKATIFAVVFNTVFGVFAAWALTKFQFRGKKLLTTLIDLPVTISPVIAGLIFLLIFGRQSPVYFFLMKLGIKVVFSVPGIIIATVFVTFPFISRELIPVLEAEGSDEEEAAALMGAGGWTIFWKITFPHIKWALLYGVVLCTARAMGEFGAVDVPDSNIVNRMSGRRACLKCGATYHVVHAAPKVEGVCDTCGEKLVLRDDDQPETVQKRLNVYHEQTQPLIDYYTKEGILKSVDGTKDLEEVFADIVAILGE